MGLANLCGLFSAALLVFSGAAQAQPRLHFAGATGPAVDIVDYSYAVAPRPLALQLNFAKTDAEHVQQLFRANLGAEVSVWIGDQILLTPTVRSVPEGRGLEVTFADADSFAKARLSLSTAPTAP